MTNQRRKALEGKEKTFAISMVLSMVLWNIPFGSELMLPFKFFTTFVHESCHALVMALSGAGVEGIEIFADTSGTTKAQISAAPWAKPIIASAGYMGTSLIGALLLAGTKNADRSKMTLFLFGALILLMGLLWSSNTTTMVIAVTIFSLVVVLVVEPFNWVREIVHVFCALQLSLHAVLDIRVLFNPNLVINGETVGLSDAHNMAALTFGTPTLWAAIWIGCSLIGLWIGLKLAYSIPSGPP